MYVDIVLMKKTKEVEELALSLGYEKVLFKEDLSKFKIVKGKSENANRVAIEKKVDILLDPHLVDEKDHLHFRRSGLNHIMCKLAAKNKVIIGFSLENMFDSLLRGRVMQNIKLCRKYGVVICVFSMAKDKFGLRNTKDIGSFLRTLGMTGKEAKVALSFPKTL